MPRGKGLCIEREREVDSKDTVRGYCLDIPRYSKVVIIITIIYAYVYTPVMSGLHCAELLLVALGLWSIHHPEYNDDVCSKLFLSQEQKHTRSCCP